VFNSLCDRISVAEVFLGYVPWSVKYSVATYSATCTEAIPFNPFDKVICNLLIAEKELSFNEIGDILGLNVYENESSNKYLDPAEKEILLEALKELASSDFGMLEGGDIDFSR